MSDFEDNARQLEQASAGLRRAMRWLALSMILMLASVAFLAVTVAR